MKSKQMHAYPFLPRLLFLICAMVLAFTELHLLVHLLVLTLFALYEAFILPKDAFRASFLKQTKKYVGTFMVLFGFYAFFLRIGQNILIQVEIFGVTWTLYQESILYALHYVLLFLEVLWVTYLIFHEEKIDQMQCFFYGNLFSLTLIWNGSIQQAKQVMELKKDFDQALIARGYQPKVVKKVLLFFEYTLEHMMIKVFRQIPLYQRMWKNRRFYATQWKEKIIWTVPVFLLMVAFLKEELTTYMYLKVQTLIAVLGIALVYSIIHDQYEEMTPSNPWLVRDKVFVIFLVFWLVHRFYQVDAFHVVAFDTFLLIQHWPLDKFLSLIFLVMGMFLCRRAVYD